MIADKLRVIVKRVLGVSIYESIIFFFKNGYWPDYQNPETFNEKISFKKINSEDERFVRLSDKYKVRSYVKQKIGEEYLTDIYATYDDSSDFNLDKLPDQFVLKANHASGKDFIKIIQSKGNIDEHQIKSWMNWALKQNYGELTNEWWYQEIKPRKIIAEELLNPEKGNLKDYKFFVNNGKVDLIQVDQNRFKKHSRNIYDSDWNDIEVKLKYPRGGSVSKPLKLERMKSLAIKLSDDFKFCRVDLYLTENKKIKFSELTFTPGAGWDKFTPLSYDKKLGRNLGI